MKVSKLALCTILLMMILISVGCGSVQNSYYEIQIIVVNEELFYFINPSEGEDTFSQNQFGTGQNQFLYLYEPIEGVDFNYDQFFSNIGSRYIEKNISNEKYYLLSTQEIDNLVNQYFVDRDAWKATHLSRIINGNHSLTSVGVDVNDVEGNGLLTIKELEFKKI